jgi:hypothetical protein
MLIAAATSLRNFDTINTHENGCYLFTMSNYHIHELDSNSFLFNICQNLFEYDPTAPSSESILLVKPTKQFNLEKDSILLKLIRWTFIYLPYQVLQSNR